MMRALLRHDDEVRMRDSVAVHEVADALQTKRLAHASSKMLGDPHDVRGQCIGYVREVVDMLAGNDEAFAWCRGLQSHKRRDLIIAINEACRRTAGDDLAENAGHCGLQEYVWLPNA